MKIITWNINGYRSITGQNPSKRYNKVSRENQLFKYIKKEKPDIICLQETKASIEQINEDLQYPFKYFGYYNSCETKKGYSGVVTFSKSEPKKVNYKLGIKKFDEEGRVVETHFKDFILLNIYFPKGYAASERLDFKLEFYDIIIGYCKKLKKINKNIIICGDFNTAHHPIDLARPEQNHGTSGFMPIEREKLDLLINNGYLDTFRHFVKDTGHYTWWSQRGRARENNVGWRIDYHFVTENMVKRIKKAYQQPDMMGSDHCPVVLVLK
ncbi:exodeoxyribonuclease III [Bacteroidota bacterium]